MAIVSSPYGGALVNAYATWAEVNSYITTACVFFKEWLDATTVQGSAAIIRASNNIDALNWSGEKVFVDQFLEFPKTNADWDSGTLDGSLQGDSQFQSLLTTDVYYIQQKTRVQQATAEQALHVLRVGGRLPHREEQFKGIGATNRSPRVGASFSYVASDMILCPEAWDKLREYAGSIRIRRA